MPLYIKSRIIALVTSLLIACIGFLYSYSLYPPTSTSPKTYHLSIVAAHNEKIKELIVPFLQKQCKKRFNAYLHVEWVKHGGQNTNVKVLDAIFKKNKEATCGHDIIWGGGEIIFYKLVKEKRLTPLFLTEKTKKYIPSQLAGTPLYTKTWAATCLSTFGMIYNKTFFNKLGLPNPTSWEALASPKLFEKVVAVDPCQSSNIWTIYVTILQAYGWEKGWEILVKMAANSVVFLDKSSSAASSIAQGMGLIGATNDFYAQGTIHTHGREKLGFIIPRGQNILNADPIAILKGAPNKKMAIFCIECILSPEFQCLLMHKKQTPHGPTNYTIGRIAVNKKAYEMAKETDIGSAINPFKTHKNQPMQLNTQKATRQYPIVSALFKAYCIAPHKQLKQAWRLIIQHGCKPEDIQHLAAPPLTEEQIKGLTIKWKDPLFRQKLTIQWTNQAIERYQHIINRYKNKALSTSR